MRSLLVRDGLLGLRLTFTVSNVSSLASTADMAVSLFWCWDRLFLLCAVSVSLFIVAISSTVNKHMVMSRVARMRLSLVLACCPPGPPLVLVSICSAALGTCRPAGVVILVLLMSIYCVTAIRFGIRLVRGLSANPPTP